jgi:hypothetical protein
MIADCFTGAARADGPTRDAAFKAWIREVERVKPFPEPIDEADLPEAFMEQMQTEDGFRMQGVVRGPKPDLPWIDPTVETIPGAIVPVEGSPGESPFGRRVWLVGGAGAPCAAHLRDDPDGFTLIGDRIFEELDIDTLDDLLAPAAQAAEDRIERDKGMGFSAGDYDTRLETFDFADRWGNRQPLSVGSIARSYGFRARSLNADNLHWSVVRMRRV